jgi:dTDP-L-rhamnose 4-epimerase
VSVRDVAQACVLALETSESAGAALNIGSGESFAIAEIAERLARVLGREDLTPELTGTYRMGDIRNCFADIGRARELLGYQPSIALDAGLGELAEWLETQVATDRADEARAELTARGLTV